MKEKIQLRPRDGAYCPNITLSPINAEIRTTRRSFKQSSNLNSKKLSVPAVLRLILSLS